MLGAGLMGAGIAHVSVDKGYNTTLKDMAMDGLMKGQQQIEKGLGLAVKKRKMSEYVLNSCVFCSGSGNITWKILCGLGVAASVKY